MSQEGLIDSKKSKLKSDNDSISSSSGTYTDDELTNTDIQNPFNTPYASSWFDTEYKMDLLQYMRKLMQISKSNLLCNLDANNTKAILVPHAGIKFSGLCSASAYFELTNRTNPIKNIILLCTNHYSSIPASAPSTLNNSTTYSTKSNKSTTNNKLNIIAPSFTKITTSLLKNTKTTLDIDIHLINKIKSLVHLDSHPFYNEHSFFNQIPFLELVAPNASICPLLIGDLSLDKQNAALLNLLIKILREKLAKPDTILICSSDLSHINGHFPLKVSNNIFQNIRKQDNETLQFLYNIVDGNESRNKLIDTILFMQNTTTCGINAIYLFGRLLHSLNNNYSSSGSTSSDSGSDVSYKSTGHNNIEKYLYSRVSCYYSSITRDYIKIDNFHSSQLIPLYEISNNKKASVSYASVIFTKQPYIQSRGLRKIDKLLTEYEKLALLGLARETLYYFLSPNKMPSNLIRPINAPAFTLPLGVFSTLHKLGHGIGSKLRGCIGTLETNNDEINIESNVKKYVIESAIRDSRFSPISMDEFNQLEFSITILDTMKPITLNQYMTDKFQLGRDGILMKIGGRQGYFLPSVASDLKLKKTEKGKLLDELCREKVAGCDSKTIFRKHTNIQLFYNEGLEFNI